MFIESFLTGLLSAAVLNGFWIDNVENIPKPYVSRSCATKIILAKLAISKWFVYTLLHEIKVTILFKLELYNIENKQFIHSTYILNSFIIKTIYKQNYSIETNYILLVETTSRNVKKCQMKAVLVYFILCQLLCFITT